MIGEPWTARAPGLRPTMLAFFSPKGGVGKTTLAVNLAVTLAGRGLRLLLVDGSLQFGHAALALNIAERFNGATLDAYLNGGDWNVVQRSLVPVAAGGALWVLPALTFPWDADRIPGGATRRLLATVKPQFDLVLVDTHSAYNEATLDILDLADEILLIVTPEQLTIDNADDFMHLASRLGNLSKVRLIVNRCEPSTDLARLLDRLQVPLLARVSSFGLPLVEAANKGRPVVLGNPRAGVSGEIRALANRIQADLAPAAGGPR